VKTLLFTAQCKIHCEACVSYFFICYNYVARRNYKHFYSIKMLVFVSTSWLTDRQSNHSFLLCMWMYGINIAAMHTKDVVHFRAFHKSRTARLTL